MLHWLARKIKAAAAKFWRIYNAPPPTPRPPRCQSMEELLFIAALEEMTGEQKRNVLQSVLDRWDYASAPDPER